MYVLNPAVPFEIKSATVAVSITASPTFDVSSLPFINAAFGFGLNGIDNLYLNHADIDTNLYSLVLENNTVWLKYREGWNYFVGKFQNGEQTRTVYLFNSIIAGDDGPPQPFDTPRSGIGEFTVDGRGLIIDSSGTENLGFSLRNANLTFKDVHFTSFVRTRDSGGIFAAVDSVINFISDVSSVTFANNLAGESGVFHLKGSMISLG